MYSGLSADEFSHGFTKAGYHIEDTTRRFSGAFVKGDGRLRWFGGGSKTLKQSRNPNKKTLVVPVEMWEPQNIKQLSRIREQNGVGGGELRSPKV